MLTRVRCEQCFPTHDPRTLRFKKGSQVGSKKRRAVLTAIEFQKEPSIGIEKSTPHIVDKKFPVSLCPFQPVTIFVSCDSVETDAMPGNEIKLFAEIRQRCLCADSSYNAIYAEKIGRAAEERVVIGIKSEAFVPEQAAEIKEIARATAEIQDLERRRAIEPEILDAIYVDSNPVIGVFVGVDLSGIRPIWIMLAQS